MTKRLLAVLAVAVLFLAGCGDDDKKTETGSPTTAGEPTATTDAPPTTEAEGDLTLADWAEQADEICAEADEAGEALGEPEDADALFEMLPDVLEIFESQLAEIEALGTPDEMAEEVEEAISILAQQGESLADAQEAVDGGADPDEVLEQMFEDSEDLDTQLTELAEELGLEECGTDGGTTTTTEPPTTDTGGTGDAFSYGDDPVLDALWDACEGGDGAACDDLYFDSPSDSEYEAFGATCGDTFDISEAPASCEDEMGGPTGDEPFTYGDDADLDALWDACEGGNGVACDELFWGSPIDSEYETFGNTCGGLFTEDEVPLSCEEEIGGEKIVTEETGDGSSYGDDPRLDALYDSCAEGDMVACDDLFWDSPLDSEYENFGQTCGDLFTEADAPFSCEEGV